MNEKCEVKTLCFKKKKKKKRKRESLALLADSRNLYRYHKEMKFKSVFETQGGTQDFKWQGLSKGDKNQNPKKSLGLQTKAKKLPGL